MCQPGEVIELRPEPKNPADPSAVAVYSARGIQIGYIRADRCPLIHSAIRRSGVSAIFQNADSCGCVIRAHLDGTVPVLPTPRKSNPAGPPKIIDQDACWRPDDERPD